MPVVPGLCPHALGTVFKREESSRDKAASDHLMRSIAHGTSCQLDDKFHQTHAAMDADTTELIYAEGVSETADQFQTNPAKLDPYYGRDWSYGEVQNDGLGAVTHTFSINYDLVTDGAFWQPGTTFEAKFMNGFV